MMLTVDEMQVIRIHMGAIKERLCNHKRWSEAEEYQTIIDKLDTMIKMEEDKHESRSDRDRCAGFCVVDVSKGR